MSSPLGISAMSMQTFPEVWYRPDKKNFLELLAFKDIGTLEIAHGRITYRGRKARFTIKRILRVGYGRIGVDLINNWVHIDYADAGERLTAYFADGGLLGWRGIFGGSRRIFAAVESMAREDPGHLGE